MTFNFETRFFLLFIFLFQKFYTVFFGMKNGILYCDMIYLRLLEPTDE